MAGRGPSAFRFRARLPNALPAGPSSRRVRDDRPFFLLVAVAAALAVLLAIPTTRVWLAQAVWEPVRAQADPAPGLRAGYTVASLVFWAGVGGALAWAAYEALFVRAGFEPDRRFFTALAPFLLFGPLLHALLVARALPEGPLAYLAAEPLVYLTTAALAVAALLAGRALRRPVAVPLAAGALALAPLLALAAARVDAGGAAQALALLAMAAVPAVALGWAYHRWRPRDGLAAAILVVGAHALDGATTWMVLRDPLGMGFEGFGERNPVSERLVGLSNGWPYFAVKLALPLALLAAIRPEEGEERLHAFLLLAIFILGFGPGMANLLQVVLG